MANADIWISYFCSLEYSDDPLVVKSRCVRDHRIGMDERHLLQLAVFTDSERKGLGKENEIFKMGMSELRRHGTDFVPL